MNSFMGALPLLGSEVRQQRDRLSSAQRLVGRPHDKGRAENLRSGAEGEEVDLEVLKDAIACRIGYCQLLRAHLGKLRFQQFRPSAARRDHARTAALPRRRSRREVP